MGIHHQERVGFGDLVMELSGVRAKGQEDQKTQVEVLESRKPQVG